MNFAKKIAFLNLPPQMSLCDKKISPFFAAPFIHFYDP